MEPVELRTARLELRIPTRADLDEITAGCQDPEVPRWTTVPSPYTRADAAEFVQLIAQWWADESQTVWGIYVDGVYSGSIGLHHITDATGGGHAELGYWVAAEARGNGYVVEASRAVIDWAFHSLDLARIKWQAVVGNIPSARTARALGFRYEGLQRQGLTGPRGRDDGWFAGLLRTDDRTPVPWSVLDD